jgi:uroporphyrinogen-III synthase
LQSVGGLALGVITAPGGRGVLVPALRERGAEVRVAEVYQRADLRGRARRLAAFADDPSALLVASSAEAFGRLEMLLPDASSVRGRTLRVRPVVVSSARLGTQAARAGFVRVVVAEGPTPSALVAAASRIPPLQ